AQGAGGGVPGTGREGDRCGSLDAAAGCGLGRSASRSHFAAARPPQGRAIMAEGTCDVVGTAASVALEAVGHIDRARRTILIRIAGDTLWWRPLGECERPGNPNASGSSCFLPPPGALPEGATFLGATSMVT